jgi:hypothetical protein
MNIVINNSLFFSRDYSEFDTPTFIRRQIPVQVRKRESYTHRSQPHSNARGEK